MAAFETAYIASLIIGGGLMFVSTFLGSDADADIEFGDVDADFDLDVDADADIPHDPSAMSLAAWFSMQFVVYFLAAFGLIGVVLTYMSDASTMFVAIVAIIVGIAVGQTAHHTFRYLKQSGSDSAPTTADFHARPARVTMMVQPSQRGEVAVMVRGRERFVPARPKHPDQSFNVGDAVVIVCYEAGTADIISKEEHDFVANKPIGESS